jgi:hypothetical protein
MDKFSFFDRRVKRVRPLIIEIDTTLPGSSNSDQFVTQTFVGIYNITAKVNGIIVAVFNDLKDTETITFPNPGIYVLEIMPSRVNPLNVISINNRNDKRKLIDLKQWGSIPWKAMTVMFAGCENLTLSALDAPNLSAEPLMNVAFTNAQRFNPNLSIWDVSKIESMDLAFNNTALTTNNLDGAYNAWANLPSLKQDVSFGAKNTFYSSASQASRNFIIDNYNWDIDDAGLIT